MTQGRFPGFDAPPGEVHDRLFRRAINAALDAVTQERFCEFAGVSESEVSRARHARPGDDRARKWKQEWTDALLDMPDLGVEHKRAICDAIAARAGLTAAPRKKETVLDICRAYDRALRRFGEMGAGVADELERALAVAIAEGRLA